MMMVWEDSEKMSMSNEDLEIEGDSMAPDRAQARRTALIAHGVITKFKEMGLPDDFDEDLAVLGTDLADIWIAEKRLSEQMEQLSGSSKDWGVVGDQLVDLRVGIDHLAWHVKSVRRSMTKIARFAYKKADEVGLGI